MSLDWHARFLKHPRLLPEAQRVARGGASIMAVLEQYRVTETLAVSELDEQQHMLLASLAAHAAAQSPYFAGRLRECGLKPSDLGEPGGLSRLRPMSRQDIVRAKGNLFCRNTPPEHGAVGSTSTTGSTGEPVTVRRTGLCELHWSAHTLREHLWHGRDFAAGLAVIRANADGFSRHAGWGAPCDKVLSTGPALVIPPSTSLEEIMARLRDFKPGYLLVLPSVLAGLVEVLEKSGGAWEGLLGIRTLSETASTRLREDTHRVLGLEIADCYSSQEGGVMAMQCPEQGSYHIAETIILEVVDATGAPCAPGQVGRVLITDLVNFATPVVRYDIGDFAEAGSPCSCGRGMPVVRRFVGRERNLVLLPDGSRHWPVVGFHRWDEVYPIRQFQFIQLDRTRIEARFSAFGRPSTVQEEKLKGIIQEALGHPFEIHFSWQEERLPGGPGGKFEEFICKAT